MPISVRECEKQPYLKFYKVLKTKKAIRIFGTLNKSTVLFQKMQ